MIYYITKFEDLKPGIYIHIIVNVVKKIIENY